VYPDSEKEKSMAKDVQMTFRVEEELRSDFINATAMEHVPAAQVLREFMRTYVAEVSKRRSRTMSDSISATERLNRQDAVDFGFASVALEGFTPSKEVQVKARRFVDGELDVNDLGYSKV